ncbi:MAG: hypothetical protein Q8O53_02190 [Candidatus Moranbacteria bacterium]|nr:hypothetical protein [Candidatus Moranbacteria bacterium]
MIPTKENLRNELASVKREVALLRSLFISIIAKDREGEYRPTFVKEVLAKATASEVSKRVFRNAATFLKELHQA